MNINEIQSAAKHLQKTCKCPNCDARFKMEQINVVASTTFEALFEIKCSKCDYITLITIISSVDSGRTHRSEISRDDILDMKNFLNQFDGNFKKVFSKNKK